MPFRINGFGTSYFGKKNKNEVNALCSQCGNAGVLLDYDTRLWITALFIPIIPLGRKRILNYCAQCTQHKVLTLSEWEEISQSALSEGMQAMKEKPDDVDSAIQMHATLAELGKQAEAEKMAQHLRDQFGDEVDVQLYLGCWYQTIGNEQEVKRSIEAAYELDPENPVALRGKAVTQIGEGKLEQAASNLEELKPPSPHYEPQVFFMLAEAFQKQGDHKRAYEIFTDLLAATPELAQASEFQKAVKRTEKILQPAQRLLEKKPFYKSSWVQVAAAVTVAVSLFCFASLYQKSNRTVHVVNGLPEQIEIQIDEEAITVSPLSRLEVKVGEGEHLVKVLSPKKEIRPEYKFKIESNFWDRLFEKSVTVLDPTESAVVVKEVEAYGDTDNVALIERLMDDPRYQPRAHFLQKLIQYDEIDYPFQDFPDEIEMSSRSKNSIERRTGLIFLDQSPVENIYNLTFMGVFNDSKKMNKSQRTKYLERFLPQLDELGEKRLPEDFNQLLNFYALSLNEPNEYERFLGLLKHWLIQTPNDLNCAGYFESATSRMGSEKKAVSYLGQLIDEFPEVAAFRYLRGYQADSLSEAILHWEKIQNDNLEIGNVLHYALTDAYFAFGQPNKAANELKELANKNKKTEEEQQVFHQHTFDEFYCLWAAEQFDEVTQRLENLHQTVKGWDAGLVFQLQWFAFQKQEEAMEKASEEWLKSYFINQPDNSAWVRPNTESQLFYWKGDYQKAFTTFMEMNDYDRGLFMELELKLLTSEELDYEEALVEFTDEELFVAQLMVGLHQAMLGNQSEAEKWFNLAMHDEQQQFRWRKSHERILKSETVSWEELRELPMYGHVRRLIFAHMALKHPELLPQVIKHLEKYRLNNYLGTQLVNEVLTKRMQELDMKTAVPKVEKEPMVTAE